MSYRPKCWSAASESECSCLASLHGQAIDQLARLHSRPQAGQWLHLGGMLACSPISVAASDLMADGAPQDLPIEDVNIMRDLWVYEQASSKSSTQEPSPIYMSDKGTADNPFTLVQLVWEALL